MLVAVLMIVASVSAFAEVEPGVANHLTADGNVTVNGLDAGDVVTFYKIIEWKDNSGWDWVEGFTAAATAANVALPDITVVTGKMDTTKTPAVFVPGVINADVAAVLASAAIQKGNGVVTNAVAAGTTANQGSVSYNATPGLYVAIVAPGTVDQLYNPIFVAADYSTESPNSMTNSQETSLLAKSYSDQAMVKKVPMTLTKEIDGTQDTKFDVKVGDTIPFTITSWVPAYSATYVNPTYQITDTMESGLEVQTTADQFDVQIDGVTLASGDYTVTVNQDKLGFTLTVNQAGLQKVATLGEAKQITVKYNAKIISLDEGNVTVTEKTNEATVKFSNNPADDTSYSLLEDRTRNYTFSIDANLLGYTSGGYITDELVKVAVDEKGEYVYQTKEYRLNNAWKEYAPLQGAEFALFKSAPTDAQVANHAAAAAATDILYTNDVFNGFVTSDGQGFLNITGLDAGTYYLREVSAPTGYIRDNRTFTITIAATYKTIDAYDYTKTIDNKPVKVHCEAYKVLDTYTVTVNDGSGNVVSTYNILNDQATHPENVKVTMAEFEQLAGGDFAGDNITPISNTKGTELPSTGGMGTTILYIGGSILVILAAVLLITKRRMNAED